MEHFVGHYCKIIYKVRGLKTICAITCKVLDYNDAGFIVIQNENSIYYILKNKILSIRFFGEPGR